MAPQIEVLADAAAVTNRTAEVIAGALQDGGALALSGGSTPKPMYGVLAGHRLPWSRISVYQVDERLVDPDDSRRNWLAIHEGLVVPTAASGHPMPVNGGDYALPDRLDVVHLGLGADGHTASLVPGDPVLGVVDRDVAQTGPYEGTRRLTLTPTAINRARLIVWQVAGADKHAALQGLLDADPSIPAGLVRCGGAVMIIADRAAFEGAQSS